jgi:hypothetical protein
VQRQTETSEEAAARGCAEAAARQQLEVALDFGPAFEHFCAVAGSDITAVISRGGGMKHRLAVLIATLALGLAVTGSALAFDCMRVSSSMQGLQQSTRSGNWLYFNMTDGTGIAQILDFLGVSATQQQIMCLQTAYSASDAPRYFALGVGVAGGKTEHGPGVLAHQAPDKVLMNGTGIEHMDETVLPVLQAAAPGCGLG